MKQLILISSLLLCRIIGFSQPSNDNCENALPVTINVDLNCTSLVSGTLLGATASPQSQASCSGSEDDDVWFSFVATNSTHYIELSNIVGNATSLVHSVWTGTCPSLTLYSNSCSYSSSSAVHGLTVGTTYFIRVYSSITGGAPNTTFDVCIKTPPVVSNDECSNPVSVAINPDMNCNLLTSGTIQYATPSSQNNTCGGTPDDDVWFSFVATQAEHRIEITNITGSASDLYFSVWQSTCDVMVALSCCPNKKRLVTNLTVGNTYLIRVWTANSSLHNTDFDICIRTSPPPPANDECINAFILPVNPDLVCTNVVSGTTLSATGVYTNTCNDDNDDVWFRFTATSTVHYFQLLNITGTTTSYAHAMYTGSCGNLSYIPNSCSTYPNITYLNLTIGQEYFVKVYVPESDRFNFINFDVCIKTAPPPPNDDCINAITANINTDLTCTLLTAGTISGATPSNINDSDCSGVEDDDVWFLFVPNDNAVVVQLLNNSGVLLRFSVWENTCGSLALHPNTCFYSSGNVINLTAGNTYYIRVYSETDTGGQVATFDLCIMNSISNDDCDAPTAITVTPYGAQNCLVESGSLVGATLSSQETSCPGYEDHDVWFSFVATFSNLTLNINNVVGYPSALRYSLWTGTCPNLTNVLCNNAYNFTFTDLNVGQTYFLRIFGNQVVNISTTTFDICITENEPPLVNDECDGAILFSDGIPGSITGAFTNITESAVTIPSCSGRTNNYIDLWYKVITDNDNINGESLLISVMPSQDIDVSLYVYSGDCQSLILEGCSDSGLEGDEEHVLLTLANGLQHHNAGSRNNLPFYIRLMPWYWGETSPDLSFTLTTSGSALPIELVSFTGYEDGLVNILEWETASEVNLYLYELESSADGINWTLVDAIEPNKNTGLRKYQVSDQHPTRIQYYRLKSLDFDGSAQISKTIVLKRLPKLNEAFRVFPNPVEDQLELYYSNGGQTDIYKIVNTTNQIVMSGCLYDGRINVSYLPSGLYIIELKTSGQCFTNKFFKK